MIYRVFILMAILLEFTACKTTQVANNPEANTESHKIIANTLALTPKFKDLSIGAKIKPNIDGITTPVNATIFVNNHKKIWVNVTKFGINGARAEITPSGVKAYEKLQSTYIDSNFQFFNDLLKVDFINYDKLQDLLLGRIFVDLNNKDYSAIAVNGNYSIQYNKNTSLNNNPKEGEYIQTFLLDANYRLINAILSDPINHIDINVSYSNWTEINNEQLPKNVKVIVKDTKTQQVELEYNNFTFKSMDTPFSIPEGYEKREF